ncbi:MAG: UvrD-helicase domain-containing protein, partial [Anaerolineae bacterium]|nr:UvrD-helicase domain-containing protein [Anaerolineae bacterium]
MYRIYQETLREKNLVDFGDMVRLAVQALDTTPEARGFYQNLYRYVLVDEWQDTNTAQYELVRLLSAAYGNIFVVGDEDQSIYRFRGADYRNVARFRQDFPDTHVILLEQNYRSTKVILETASYVISANQQRKPKGLWTENETGLLPEIVETYTEQEEAQFV